MKAERKWRPTSRLEADLEIDSCFSISLSVPFSRSLSHYLCLFVCLSLSLSVCLSLFCALHFTSVLLVRFAIVSLSRLSLSISESVLFKIFMVSFCSIPHQMIEQQLNVKNLQKSLFSFSRGTNNTKCIKHSKQHLKPQIALSRKQTPVGRRTRLITLPQHFKIFKSVACLLQIAAVQDERAAFFGRAAEREAVYRHRFVDIVFLLKQLLFRPLSCKRSGHFRRCCCGRCGGHRGLTSIHMYGCRSVNHMALMTWLCAQEPALFFSWDHSKYEFALHPFASAGHCSKPIKPIFRFLPEFSVCIVFT